MSDSQTLGSNSLAAAYVSDQFLLKHITQVKSQAGTISKLPSPWREKFRTFSVDYNSFLYMDERLVITQLLRPIIIRSLHYGHPGRDALLATVAAVWCLRLHQVRRIHKLRQNRTREGRDRREATKPRLYYPDGQGRERELATR